MAEKPDFVGQLREARAHGDKEAAREVFRQATAWNAANRPAPRGDVAGDLRLAVLRRNTADAEAVVLDALEQQQCHLLDPDDLVWVVAQVGAWESSWRAGQAIAAWLYHHGPGHRALVAVAEQIADCDNARWLDEALLWIEPTPLRWHQSACWHVTCGCGGSSSPDPVEDCGHPPRWVVEQRGDAALRTLRAAPDFAEPGTDARRVLDAWVGALA